MTAEKKHRVEEYRSHPGVNQSLLQELIDPDKSKSKIDFDEHMGTLVDLRLYTPELFTKNYFVSTEDTSVSDAVKGILKEAYNRTNGGSLESVKPIIIACAREASYMNNITNEDNLLKNILVTKNGEKYYEGLLEAAGKIVISNADFALSNKILTKFRAAIAEMNTLHEGDILTQIAIYFTHRGVNCKALLDFGIFNRSTKRIKPVDTKVSDLPHSKYARHATTLRYDLQLAFYYVALKWLVKNDPEYKGWKVDNPSLLVYSAATDSVVEYPITDADLHVGRWGAETHRDWSFRKPIKMSGIQGSFIKKSIVYGFEDGLEIYKNSSGSNVSGYGTTSASYEVAKAGIWTA